MSIEELCALSVVDIAAEDSALFLWATFPQLPEALRLIKAWGFSYKTAAFVWLKLNKKSYTWFYGLGFWTRGNAELCLMAANKIDRINREIEKTREKITEYQNKLKGLEAQKTEAENLQIVQLVRSMRLSPQELTAMLQNGAIPGMTPAPASYGADNDEQEENEDEE